MELSTIINTFGANPVFFLNTGLQLHDVIMSHNMTDVRMTILHEVATKNV